MTPPLPRESRPWTEAEIAFLRGHYNRMRPREISAALGRSEPAIYGKADRLNLMERQGIEPPAAMHRHLCCRCLAWWDASERQETCPACGAGGTR